MAHYSLTPRVKVLAERYSHKKAPCAPNMATTLNALDAISPGFPPPSNRRAASMN
ncbi:pyruvate formate-lyase [Klebsiella michiganensis]|uniref:Pyruvate formate-lyase n=1 Tax=Klebsiella michiganensis TaxID=1134687 RepID=A0A7H4M0U9_9ENTR|nr:pyruvate formate-lyase [Klebsiella michiganensis]